MGEGGFMGLVPATNGGSLAVLGLESQSSDHSVNVYASCQVGCQVSLNLLHTFDHVAAHKSV